MGLDLFAQGGVQDGGWFQTEGGQDKLSDFAGYPVRYLPSNMTFKFNGTSTSDIYLSTTYYGRDQPAPPTIYADGIYLAVGAVPETPTWAMLLLASAGHLGTRRAGALLRPL